MRIKKRTAIVIAVFVVIILLLSIPKLTSIGIKAEASAPQGGGALLVDASVIQPQLLRNTIRTTGTLRANEEIELRSEISGKVVNILFEEGSKVRKGELLVKINDEELQAQLEKQQYQVKLAEEKESRQRRQLEIQAISQEQYDETLNTLNTIKADIQLLKAQISKTEIRAPFDGFIGLREISEGSYVSPSSAIANLVDANPIKVEFTVPERYVRQLDVNDEFTFRVQGSEKDYSGKIYAIEPRVDESSRTVLVRGMSPNPDGELMPGAFADVQLIIEEFADALLIPAESLIPELSGQKTFVLRQGIAMPVNVKTGIRTDKYIQITSGLAPGDTIITSGILQLRPGMPVQISDLISSDGE